MYFIILEVEENTGKRKPLNIESREEDPKIEIAQIPLFEDYSVHTSEEKSQMFQNISEDSVNQLNSKLSQNKAPKSKEKSFLVVKRTDEKRKTYYNRLREIKSKYFISLFAYYILKKGGTSGFKYSISVLLNNFIVLEVEKKTEERVPIIVATNYILKNQQDSNEDCVLSKTSVQETKETPAMESINTSYSSSPKNCKPQFRKGNAIGYLNKFSLFSNRRCYQDCVHVV